MRSNCPIPYTCPAIDSVISKAENIIGDAQTITTVIEDLRKANEQLREWGTEMEELAADRQKEIDYLESTISDLKAELSSTQS